MKPSKIALRFIWQREHKEHKGTQGDGSVVLLKFSDYVKPNAC